MAARPGQYCESWHMRSPRARRCPRRTPIRGRTRVGPGTYRRARRVAGTASTKTRRQGPPRSREVYARLAGDGARYTARDTVRLFDTQPLAAPVLAGLAELWQVAADPAIILLEHAGEAVAAAKRHAVLAGRGGRPTRLGFPAVAQQVVGTAAVVCGARAVDEPAMASCRTTSGWVSPASSPPHSTPAQ